MKILICDQQRMPAEALAAALDVRGYDVLAVTTTVSDALSSAGDCVPVSTQVTWASAKTRSWPMMGSLTT